MVPAEPGMNGWGLDRDGIARGLSVGRGPVFRQQLVNAVVWPVCGELPQHVDEVRVAIDTVQGARAQQAVQDGSSSG